LFDNATSGVASALALRASAAALGLSLRCGLHAGEIERGGRDIVGVAVHVAARMAASAPANDVLITEAVRADLQRGAWRLTPQGARTLKGLGGAWQLFSVQER
jgi:class 3 adenylate cyclase